MEDAKVIKVELNQDVADDDIQVESIAVSGGEKLINSFELEIDQVEYRPADVVNQVKDGIIDLFQTGQTVMRIQVKPPSLGRIDMRLISGSNGTQVMLMAELDSTNRLLEENLSQLQQALADSGVTIGGLSVGNHGSQEQQFNTFGGQPDKAQPFGNASLSSISMEDNEMQDGKWQINSTVLGLDYRV